ncbi:ParB/RepB/Spo0J family partition protein [Hydrogenimonas thermophila]|uniref:Chromosome segregation DNA-binding protein n=1 Tax=Hydrogenimonas thermophila TaxID=223786 RepID=A0A1I5SHU8_9BACT|nr:ParB/RepB/Spo0J family partition protein [Hydrogenimonas thermophila]WOE70869.1 ParB/RepB/Spo0J family partition protein [Hydrogenimonas thermophila]WOE73387.1 ParB/RepB/Spo0J family partition protein [Hydrogenimonas thermophila]SFP70334.1 chromosome segregation DNA-binding protein [Hydrogenimonas thermophila]
MKSKSLGRGLGAILGEVAEAYENEFKDGDAKDRIVELPLSKIVPNPYQPRVHFNEESINELSESIKQHGLLQPVVVIEQGEEYVLIAGERRVRASKIAGLQTIKAIIADIDRSKFRELALIENIQRESLNPVELAKSYKELIEDYGITHEELSKIIHKSRTQITNTLRLLQLCDYVLDKIANSFISQGHAKVLIGLSEREQKVVCDTIIGQKLSVRETEQLVSDMKSNIVKTEKSVKKSIGLDLSAYADIIKDNVPYKVSVKKSRVEISFSNEEELKEFLKSFTKKG